MFGCHGRFGCRLLRIVVQTRMCSIHSVLEVSPELCAEAFSRYTLSNADITLRNTIELQALSGDAHLNHEVTRLIITGPARNNDVGTATELKKKYLANSTMARVICDASVEGVARRGQSLDHIKGTAFEYILFLADTRGVCTMASLAARWMAWVDTQNIALPPNPPTPTPSIALEQDESGRVVLATGARFDVADVTGILEAVREQVEGQVRGMRERMQKQAVVALDSVPTCWKDGQRRCEVYLCSPARPCARCYRAHLSGQNVCGRRWVVCTNCRAGRCLTDPSIQAREMARPGTMAPGPRDLRLSTPTCETAAFPLLCPGCGGDRVLLDHCSLQRPCLINLCSNRSPCQRYSAWQCLNTECEAVGRLDGSCLGKRARPLDEDTVAVLKKWLS